MLKARLYLPFPTEPNGVKAVFPTDKQVFVSCRDVRKYNLSQHESTEPKNFRLWSPIKMENQASSNCIIDPRNFIAEIRAKPELWNPTSRKYKNKTLKENTWMKISKKFNTPVLNCLNLWKNLRDQYVKKRKTIERMPSGSAATRAKEWFLFQSMTFLDVAKGGNKRQHTLYILFIN
uniref:MADF domain-containing protein n=1 Tax=Romanomermis culicivorax TaxID=13658 RepID=A0A915KAL1_ROMCU